MFAIISEEFLVLCNDYLINEKEASAVTNKLKSVLAGDTMKDMYASENRKQFAIDLLEPLFEEQVKSRKTIEMPTEEAMRVEMKKALKGVVFVH